MNYYKHKKLIESNGIFPFVDDYLDMLLTTGKSERTHINHQSSLRDFILFCTRLEINNISDINKTTLKNYRKNVYNRRKPDGMPLAKSSMSTRLSATKKFIEWCAKEKIISENFSHDFEIPKKPRGLPTKIIMHDAVEHVLSQPDITTDFGFRDRVIMEVLYATGMRRTEASLLKYKEVDFVRKTVVITESKNGESRHLPIGERALDWIDKYMKNIRPKLLKGEDDGRLFLSHEGIQFKPGTLASRVKNYIKQSGIDTRGACHLFRHSVATQMLENGAGLRQLQVFLGHKDITSTEIYTRVSPELLFETYAKTHPMELH